MEPDWANLDAFALSLVLDKLEERIDHIWFSVVCKGWQSVAKLNHQNQQFLTNVMPMLMIPTKRKSRTKTSLYGIPSNRVYPTQLPVPYNRRCCGSSHGWLATVNDKNVITLLNPFKSIAPITLPPLNRGGKHANFYECNMRKVTLSVDPITSPNNYIVVAIYSMQCRLAFIRANQSLWTYISYEFCCYTDVMFYKGLVYAVSRWNNIVSFPTSNEKMIPNIVLQGSFNETYCHRAYLVKSLEGDLWMVRRFLAMENDEGFYPYNNTGSQFFEVYKLELDVESGKLQQMLRLENLGDNVLFVGDNDSISVSASYFTSSLQANSIYYTDDFNENSPIPYVRGPFDIGIYNVKDESFVHHYLYKHSFKRMPPPFWVLPHFKWD